MRKKIAVLTSGGDSPGMNPAIRAVARTAQSQGMDVIGISDGYEGIFEKSFIELDNRTMSGILDRGGTFLQSSRCKRFYTSDGIDEAVQILREEKISGLIVIGGDGSLTGAQEISRRGYPTIGIPGSIDNDIWGTDMSIGVDTAANTIMAMVDRIKDTARSHRRCFLIEVMGRNSGYLALITAISCGAEIAVIPEFYYNPERILKLLEERFEKTKDNSIILLAEGVSPANEFYQKLLAVSGNNPLAQEFRISVLGHVQRGGIPTHFDRVLANRMGELAVIGLGQGEMGVMTALKKSRLTLLDYDKIIGFKKHPAPELIRLARNLGIEFGDVVET